MQNVVDKVAAPFKNGVLFVIIYLLFLLPTYYLPYVGSNSSIVAAIGAAAGAGLSPQFWAHVASLFVLIVATWLRGCAIGKQWIVIFPIVASVFDMTPGLSIIPLIPTAMHVTALIMGARGATAEGTVARVPVIGGVFAFAIGAVIISGLMYSWSWQSRVNQPVAIAPSKLAPGRPEALMQSRLPSPSGDTAAAQQSKSNKPPVRELIGTWADGGPGCASISRGQTRYQFVLRAWYCEADSKSAIPIILEQDVDVDTYAHELTGLSVKLLQDGNIRVSAPGNVRDRLGEGTYLAEEVRDFQRQ